MKKQDRKNLNTVGHNAAQAKKDVSITKNSVGIFCFMQGGGFILLGLFFDFFAGLLHFHVSKGFGMVQAGIMIYGVVWVLGGLYIRKR